MRTIVYIDGFNLYYGRLKQTRYKWLDLFSLFESILHNQDPAYDLVKIKFFTADVQARFSTHGLQAQQSQTLYHNALTFLYGDRLEIHKGFYTTERASALPYLRPPSLSDRVDVWRLEEKQTDVLMALEMYRDAMRGECDWAVVCSNDTDLEPGLRRIQEDSAVQIGVVIPRDKERENARPPNKRLSQYAAWTRDHILQDELSRAQLPNPVLRSGKAPIRRPFYW